MVLAAAARLGISLNNQECFALSGSFAPVDHNGLAGEDGGITFLGLLNHRAWVAFCPDVIYGNIEPPEALHGLVHPGCAFRRHNALQRK
jgi:hypothetical protein